MTINRTLAWLTIADLVAVSSFGLILPIFALFLFDTIPGATVQNIAMSQAIFLGSKAIFDLILSSFNKHNKTLTNRTHHSVALGYLTMSIVPLGYAFAQNMGHIFLLQLLLGLGVALAGTAWHDLFIASTDQRWQGSEFRIYHTAVGFACAATAISGGIIAQLFGYQSLLLLLSGLSASASIMTLFAVSASPVAKPRSLRGRRTTKRSAHTNR